MFHAAAMLAGLAAIWLVLWPSGDRTTLALGAGAALGAALMSWRLGATGREAAPYLDLPSRARLAFARVPAIAREAMRIAHAAFAPALKPALVRMRTRDASETARASAVRSLSAQPGVVVVETSADAFLLHVNDEDVFDPGEAIVLETSVIAAMDGRR